jgi:hypothetical protein
MEIRMRTALALAFLAACSGAPVVQHNPMAPVTARIEVVGGEPGPGEHMRFRAHLDKHGTWDAPIAVEFRVPVGASVVGGVERGTVSGGETPELELMLDRVPDGDLVLVASSQTEAAGFHAEARYRFGRAAPVKSGPDKSGPPMTGPNGADLGSPVDMN